MFCTRKSKSPHSSTKLSIYLFIISTQIHGSLFFSRGYDLLPSFITLMLKMSRFDPWEPCGSLSSWLCALPPVLIIFLVFPYFLTPQMLQDHLVYFLSHNSLNQSFSQGRKECTSEGRWLTPSALNEPPGLLISTRLGRVNCGGNALTVAMETAGLRSSRR